MERKEEVNDWDDYVTYAEYDNVKYTFQSESFDEASAKKQIGMIATLIQDTDTFFPSETHGEFTVYLGFEPDDAVSITSPLIVPVEETLSFDNIWEIMKRAHPKELISAEQYGLLFRYCKDNGLLDTTSSEADDTESANLKTFFNDPENLYFLDFNIPMLDAVYFSEEQASIIRRAVTDFATWYMDTYSFKEYETLCKTIGTYDKDTLTQAKNDWLKSIGCSTEYTELAKIPFRYCDYCPPYNAYAFNPNTNKTEFFTYEFETVDAIWRWDDLDITTYGYTDMVTNFNHVEPLRLQCYAKARDFLKDYLPDDLDKIYLHTIFEKGKDKLYSGLYSQGVINFYGNWNNVKYSALHEYVHHLTFGSGKMVPTATCQFEEWIATWVESYRVDNPLSEESLLELVDPKEEGWWDYKNNCTLPHMRAFLTILDKFENKKTLDTTRTIEATKEVPWPVSISSLFYSEYGALTEYIYQTYGMEKLAALVKTNGSNGDFKEVLGVSFDQLYFDMIRWVQEQVDEMESRTVPR
ncbi:MAG: hypothetical protein ACI4CC_04020 [Lachnospiraceae bacterium]